ncbi:hypothetical protein R77567_01059 [Ralstonia sp. LMG 32965]|uniref:Uncharacterized protein n=1 Tax=Ralstonia flatus TaxID=3058601 RepID=A0AAD2F7N9_9RALS|nr:hypothetical protein R77567_01059 [Ralstonia sp. LMG 32965]CAJ0863784.1 hypothetical protein R77564_01043 [Ralstonia sp. LMG 32965]
MARDRGSVNRHSPWRPSARALTDFARASVQISDLIKAGMQNGWNGARIAGRVGGGAGLGRSQDALGRLQPQGPAPLKSNTVVTMLHPLSLFWPRSNAALIPFLQIS